MILEKAHEKDLPNGGHLVDSAKSCFIYWFDNGCQVRDLNDIMANANIYCQLVTTGSLKAQFDQHGKIDLLDLQTEQHAEYVPRNKIQPIPESPDQKPSPNAIKHLGKRGSQQRNNRQLQVPQDQTPLTPSPPPSIINDYGITQPVSVFLEVFCSLALLFE